VEVPFFPLQPTRPGNQQPLTNTILEVRDGNAWGMIVLSARVMLTFKVLLGIDAQLECDSITCLFSDVLFFNGWLP
jgi:hypothetical protein